MELGEFQGQSFCSITVPLDFYGCGVQGGKTSGDRASRTLTGAKSAIEAIRSLLCTVPSEYGWVME